MPRREREDPSEWPVRKAVDRYLSRRQTDATEQSIKSWYYQLKLFVEWCEGVGIETVGELRPYDLDEYYDFRGAKIAPSTLEAEMWCLKGFVGYLTGLGAVETALEDAIRIPDLDPEDRTNEVTLRPEAALALLEFFRSDPEWTGKRFHVFLEIAWFTGARLGGIRSLDIQDVHLEERYLEFRHRPESGTPLKNKLSGERPVGLPASTVEAIRRYLEHDRPDVRDEHDRAPLLASHRGRPGLETVRVWSYQATQPCLHGPCPHGKRRDTCLFTEHNHASKCPSSRSPHKIRSGSITYQLNRGLPPAVVAERVNAQVETIEQHYDFASQEERWDRYRDRMEKRRQYVDILDEEGESP